MSEAPARHDHSPEQLLCLLMCDVGLFSGAGAALLRPELGQRKELAATDPTIQELAEIQFTLWGGPGPEAFDRGRPVIGDTRFDGRRWPLLTAEVGQKGLIVQGQAVVPLTDGATTIGLVCAYRSDAVAFTDTDIHLMTAYGHALAATVVHRYDRDGIDAPNAADAPVSTAVGMLMSYSNISQLEAVARLRAHAFSSGATLTELADALCQRRIPLSELNIEG